MSWTDERVSLLKKMWGEGRTAKEIAEALGNGVTRNAVIGKAHRLSLSARVSPIQQNKKQVKAPVINDNVQKKDGIQLKDLKDSMCRWPHGDPKEKGFHFCGAKCVPNLPYCLEHAKIAYQAPKSRQVISDEFIESFANDTTRQAEGK